MPYPLTNWKDHISEYPNRYKETDNGDGTITLEKNEGAVVQEGTTVGATNLNKQEKGIFEGMESAAVLYQALAQAQRDIMDNKAEVGEATLTNTMEYPFNNSQMTVAIVEDRNTIIDYEISTEVITSDGEVGEVIVSDKQVNGFKLEYTGSASSATIKYYLRGGIQ